MPDTNIEPSNSRGIPKHARYGGQLGTYRIHRRNITADEAVPTEKLQAAVVGDRFQECRWVIQMPAGITTYDVHLMRWVAVTDAMGNEIVPGFFVEEDVITATEHLVVDQYVNGDPLAIYIDGTAGAFGTGFVILRKGVNKTA